jgi:hypothetical protein
MVTDFDQRVVDVDQALVDAAGVTDEKLVTFKETVDGSISAIEADVS